MEANIRKAHHLFHSFIPGKSKYIHSNSNMVNLAGEIENLTFMGNKVKTCTAFAMIRLFLEKIVGKSNCKCLLNLPFL